MGFSVEVFSGELAALDLGVGDGLFVGAGFSAGFFSAAAGSIFVDNVAGADPSMRSGQSTKGATHLIKVAVETALGLRPMIEVFGTDYQTPDGTCIRDYIHVSDLVRAHSDALRHLRDGGASVILNCGYGRGFSVLDVIDTVKRVSGVDFKVTASGRRPGDPPAIIADSGRIRALLGWAPQCDDLETIVDHALKWEHRRASAKAGTSPTSR